MERLPTEILTAGGEKEFGIDPLDIVEVLAIAEPPVKGPPGYGIVIRFVKPYDLAAIRLPDNLLLANTELNNRLYLQSQNPRMPGFYMPDDKTLLVAPDRVMREMLANQQEPVAGPLSNLVKKADGSSDLLAVVMIEPMRPIISGLLTQAAPAIPPPRRMEAFDSSRTTSTKRCSYDC